MSGAVAVRLADQILHLLPERAIYWENAHTLLLADTHWGKAATFRVAGLPVPGGTTAAGLSRLDFILEAFPIRRLLFLGDFFHAREGRAPGTLADLHEWRRRRSGLELILVRGNHDRQAGDPPAEMGIQCVDAPLHEGMLAFAHHPVALPGAFVLAGHIHPAVRLVGRGRQRHRAPCFWFTEKVAVLPAFGDFTGAGLIEPAPSDRVYVIAGEAVVEASHLAG